MFIITIIYRPSPQRNVSLVPGYPQPNQPQPDNKYHYQLSGQRNIEHLALEPLRRHQIIFGRSATNHRINDQLDDFKLP